MLNLPFTFMYPAVLGLAVLILPVLLRRRRRTPTVGHSNARLHSNLPSFPLVAWLPTITMSAFLLALVATLARPVVPEAHEVRTMETRDIVIAVDISGSMDSAISGGRPPWARATPPPPRPGSFGGSHDPNHYRKLDAAQDTARMFAEQRKGDRLALFRFDDKTYYDAPLTDDLKIILRKAERLNTISGGGTNFEGPTKNDPREGPLQAALDHFKEYGLAKTKVIILISDGEAPISQERHDELVAQMKELGVRIYVLGIGDGWSTGGDANESASPVRKLVKEMNGKCFTAADASQLQQSFETINQLELSRVQVEQQTTYRDIYHIFAQVSVALLVLFLASVFVTREAA